MPEITTNRVHSTPDRLRFVWFGLFVFVVLVYFLGLSVPLLGPDEPRYAQVAREMFERGDWVTPTLGGFNWFEKPALLYWSQIVAYKLFGVSEFAARLGPAIFGLGTIACLWFLGKFVEGRAPAGDGRDRRDLARWLSLIAATSLGIVVFSRGASFDIVVTFPVTAALVSFYLFDQRRSESLRAKWLPLTLFYIFIGIALLAKGLIGIVFPFGIVGLYYLMSFRIPDKAFMFSLLWGTVLALGVAAIWYVPMYERHGYQFIDEFFVQHHFQRFTSNKYQHPQPFYFFLWVLPLMMFPWLPLFLAAAYKGVRDGYRRLRDQAGEARPDPLKIFGFAWLLVPLGFFSMSGSKLPGYILPAAPGAIIVTALLVAELARKSRAWRIAAMTTGSLTLAPCAVLLLTIVPGFADGDSVKGLIALADSRGYTNERVLNFHSTSHNAEFYAAGRLVRDAAGKQREYWSPGDLRNDIAAFGGQDVLVFVRLEHLSMLRSDPGLDVDMLGDNGETAITRVSLKRTNQPSAALRRRSINAAPSPVSGTV
jgi:4-amino-4-deoxy-L-arabinose transferase-like glycosyltransferase